MNEQSSSATKRPTDRAAVLLAIDDAVRAADVREVRTLLQVLLALDRPASAARRGTTSAVQNAENGIARGESATSVVDTPPSSTTRSLTDAEILNAAISSADALDATRVSEMRAGGWHATTIFDGDTGLLRFGRLVEKLCIASATKESDVERRGYSPNSGNSIFDER